MDCYILELEYSKNVRTRLNFTIAWNGEKEIVALIGSLQAAIASFFSAFAAVWNIKGKLKEKLKYVR